MAICDYMVTFLWILSMMVRLALAVMLWRNLGLAYHMDIAISRPVKKQFVNNLHRHTVMNR